jgi:hypothetical protein
MEDKHLMHSTEKNLRVSLVDTKYYADKLQHALHREIGDMSMIYIVENAPSAPGKMNALPDDWSSATAEEIHEAALKNSPKILPPHYINMDELFNAGEQFRESSMWSVDPAAAIFYPGEMDRIAERLGGGYYIFPSSIYEMIVLPEGAGHGMAEGPGGIENAVHFLNDRFIQSGIMQEAERLSEEVYHYDPVMKRFERAAEWKERMQP